MKRPIFENGEIYHIYNRGVEKRNIFLDDHDYFRFTYGLYEFNDENPALNIYYKSSYLESYEVQLHKGFYLRERTPIVEILGFCLMDNHFHLVIRQTKE